MTKKVVKLKAVKPTPGEPKAADPDLLLALDEFTAVLKDQEARAFAAVVVNADGDITPIWHTTMPQSTTLGAIELLKIEMLKSDFLLSLTD